MKRALLTRDEAIAQMGWVGYCKYVGDQFEYERQQVIILLTAYWNGRLIDRNWDDNAMPEDAELDELEAKAKPHRGDQVNPSSRKSKSNPAHAGNDVVYMIDIQRALAWFGKDPANAVTRTALYLQYGEGMTREAIGRHFGMARQSMAERIDKGIGQITNYLNGTQ